MVLAGLPSTISSVLNDHVLTFLNRAVKIELPPLKINEVAVYYSTAFSELGIAVPEDMIKEAAEASEGSPFMMQLIGHYITLYSNEEGKVETDDLRRGLDRARNDFTNDICKTILNELSEKDIEYLQAMSEDDKGSEISAVRGRLGISEAYVQTYKRRLIQAGVIRQVRRGVVEFAVPYLQEYLRDTEDR